MKLRYPLLLAGTVALASAPSTQALTIDFESYNVNALQGQNGGSGTAWSGSSWINVAESGGNNFIAYPTTQPGTGLSSRIAATDAEIGLTFSSSVIVNYSFQIRSDATPGSQGFDTTNHILLGSQGGGNTAVAALALRVYSNGQIEFANDGSFVRMRLDGTASGTAADLDNQTGFRTISGQLNYGTETFTIFFDGVQQTQSSVAGSYAFRGAAANTFSAYGNAFDFVSPAAGTNWRPLSIDNLSFTAIPEPSAAAALFGFAALGMTALRRRRRT